MNIAGSELGSAMEVSGEFGKGMTVNVKRET
jgi:hypothetical protein